MHAAALHSARSEDTGSSAAAQSIEALGRRICEALPPLRLHSVSICDVQCNVLWLSEGALGPDEHALVTDALERFGSAGRVSRRASRTDAWRCFSRYARHVRDWPGW